MQLRQLWHTACGSGAMATYKVHLLISKAKINILGMKNIPQSEIDSAMLVTWVVEAWHDTEPIKKAVMIGDSNAVLGAWCRNSAPFSE